MINSIKEIERRLSVLQGLELSSVNHAADMLTLGFGTLRPVTNFRGAVKYVGEWALHIQCAWRLEKSSRVAATEDDLRGGDEKASATVERLQRLLLGTGAAATVESVTVKEASSLLLSLSGDFCLAVSPDALQEEEDWRFFAPSVNAAHLVITQGKIAPESFD
jgi:hypothetical protein